MRLFVGLAMVFAIKCFGQPVFPALPPNVAPIANPYSASWVYYSTDSISGLSFLGGITTNSSFQQITNVAFGAAQSATNGFKIATTNIFASLINTATNGFIDGATAGTIALGIIPNVVSGILMASNYATQPFVTNALIGLINAATNGFKPYVTNTINALVNVTTLTAANVNTNLLIAGLSQELIYTNWITLNLFSTNGVNRVYIWNGLEFSNAAINYTITNNGTQFRLLDPFKNILSFITSANPVGQWTDNLMTGSGVSSYGRYSDFSAQGNANGLLLTNIPASGIVGTIPIGDLPSYVVTNNGTGYNLNNTTNLSNLPNGSIFIQSQDATFYAAASFISATNNINSSSANFIGRGTNGSAIGHYQVDGSNFAADFGLWSPYFNAAYANSIILDLYTYPNLGGTNAGANFAIQSTMLYPGIDAGIVGHHLFEVSPTNKTVDIYAVDGNTNRGEDIFHVNLAGNVNGNARGVSLTLAPAKVVPHFTNHIAAAILSHTFTSTDGAFANYFIGDNFAMYADNAQFTVTKVTSANSVQVLENTAGGYSSTTNYTYYPNIARVKDINGNSAGFIANDGSVGIAGSFGANSGRLMWPLGSSGIDWYVQIDASGRWSLNNTYQTPYNASAIVFDPQFDYEAIHMYNDGTVGIRFGLTNKFTGILQLWGSVSVPKSISTAAITNTSATASTVAYYDANKSLTSIPAAGSLIPVAVTLGASTFLFTNTTASTIECQFSGSVAYSITKYGSVIYGSLAGDAYFTLPVNGYCGITYSVAPTLFTNSLSLR